MALSRCHVATKPRPPHARLHPFSSQVQRRVPTRENGQPARKKTETHHKAEPGKKCMPGRRAEERVKSNEATEGTRGSQRPSKGPAQERGHGRHTASTTPHRDTGEGSTRQQKSGTTHHDTHGTDTTHTAHIQRAPAARPVGGQSGEGQRLTSDAPHNGGRHPPRGHPSATPTASNAGPQGRTLWGRCWIPTPAPTAPGTHGSRNPGCPLQRTGGWGRDSA